jgi:hypothetical protein
MKLPHLGGFAFPRTGRENTVSHVYLGHILKHYLLSWVWWCISVIPALQAWAM